MIALLVAASSAWSAAQLGLRQAPLDSTLLAAHALTTLRHFVEIFCGLYAVAFTYAALRYLTLRRRPPVPPAKVEDGPLPALGVVYLCCGDLEEEALESLSRLRLGERALRVVHDDSRRDEDRRRVDAAVRRISERTGVSWSVLRRPDKSGGKPGALRYLLERIHGECDFFLLADNDSYAPDPELVARALPSFEDPSVAVVQLRNRARVEPDAPAFGRTIASAIDMFDVFMSGLFDRFWRPFIGHNAILRTRAVMEAGGFTPGVLADDVDLTVRLGLRGERVAYRRDLSMEEAHPSNYRSFCLRSRKWACGCGQVLRAHLGSVLSSSVMSLREKLGFLIFTGFYVAQAAMLAYILLVFFLLPVLLGASWDASLWAVALGTAVPASVFFPVVVYLLTEGREQRIPFFRTLAACVGTYGSVDFWTCTGLVQGLRSPRAHWVPTNTVLHQGRPWLDWAHFGFGAACLTVPLGLQAELLLFPVTWLFSAKYLFVPAVSAHYGWTAPVAPQPARPAMRLARASLVLLVAAGVAVALMAPSRAAGEPEAARRAAGESEPRVAIEGSEILVDGQAARIRGVHYSPWRPGTGPGRSDYPDDRKLSEDLDLIRDLHANVILAYDPPARLLARAHERDLLVLYTFHISWGRLPDGESEEIQDDIVSRVERLHEAPGVFAWMLGNEIPGWVVDAMGADGVRRFLSETRRRIREIDPDRPVCHGNWPLRRGLDLDRDMDLLCYNVYPYYPTEIPVSGYERFLREEIVPLAGDRPLLITEFGLNTLEASPKKQAKVLRECWWDLLDAGAQGGVVFAFADEWWKNFDNPVRPPDWWRRRPAPKDHLTADRDPEEHYGIVTSDRRPKPAYWTVREMFAEAADDSLAARVVPWAGGVAAVAMVGVALWLWWTAPGRPRAE